MKGQTIIELKNVKTGEKKRYVDNNMMTNALTKYLANCGLTNNLNIENMVENLLGGIVVFDNTIEEDADIVYPPAGIKMIGNGSYGTMNSGETLEMGSWNENESGWQSDGSFVQTYDFNTSQANGEIACVCLTSKNGGYAGFGNSITNTAKSPTDVYNLPGQYKEMSYEQYKFHVLFSQKNSTLTVIRNETIQFTPGKESEHFSNTGKIILDTYRVPMTIINIKGTLNNLILIKSETVTLPETFKTACGTNTPEINADSDGNIWLSYCNWISPATWTSSNPLRLVKIADGIATEYNLANTTGEEISSEYKFHIIIEYGKVIIANYNMNKYIIIDINTGASSEIPLESNINWYDNTSRQISRKLKGRVVLTNNRNCSMLDLSNNTLYKMNMSDSIGCAGVFSENPMIQFLDYSSSYSTYCRVMRRTDYIASINNLDKPVTKNAEYTMKIIYRITF